MDSVFFDRSLLDTWLQVPRLIGQGRRRNASVAGV